MTVNRRHALLVLAGASVALPFAGCALAQTAPASGSGLDSYVQQTLLQGAIALKASEIARDKATDENVKQFAALEIAEQQTIAGILAATPAGKAAPAIPADRQAELDNLSAMPAGEDFDLTYVEAQIKGHNELLAVQQMASGNRDASVEAVTARLAEQAVTSHIAMLGLIQQMLGSERIENIQQGKNPDGSTAPAADAVSEPQQ